MLHFGDFDLAALLPFIAVGFAAQLVDGALGMAFGVISNTLLVGILGVPPALASQRVHVVECFTTGVSGISHLIHRKVVGTVNSAEFFLTVTISASFIDHLGIADLAGATLGLLIGGLLAAPLGAWAAKHFPAKQMLILVGIVLTLTSAYGVWNAWG